MQLYINNSRYADSNILFGRVFPAMVTVFPILSLVFLLSVGVTKGTAVPILMSLLLIAVMVVVYVRRGRHPAVQSIEFLPHCINVCFFSRRSSFDTARIRNMEYEGVRNRTRVKVVNAPFPKDGERILVVTLFDNTELRVRVDYEHHATLQRIAAQHASPHPVATSGDGCANPSAESVTRSL